MLTEDYSYLLKCTAGIDDDLILLLTHCRFGERTIIIKKALRMYMQSQVSSSDLLEELLFIQEQIRDLASKGIAIREEVIEEYVEVPVDERVHNALMEFGL
jgi:hypothetical protein